ncbi:glycosyltransferase family 4 protein [Patescibacteria group bacterium]|nr:glycosyltransferase family 4 protein [Patescibacteria group bacterium]MBP9709719.1 glycosyltransferase family 4 protein [Patescibacteria group bacterium]
MHIFMSGDTYLPLVGGAEVHVFELQKRLRALGHAVTLLVTDPRIAEEDKMFPVLRAAWSLKRVPQLFVTVWRASRTAEVFHVHNCYRLGVVVGFVARLRRKPCVVTLHGLGLLDIPDNSWFYTRVHHLYRTLSLLFATEIISTSEDLAEVCRRYSSRPLVVIPNGLDTLAFHPTKVAETQEARFADAEPMILTVRRLVPKNGIHYLISALPFILKQFPHAKLVMIGDGRMRENLEARAKHLGVYDACLFLGALPNAQVPPLAKRADVVVFPSTAESTSIACAEMMAMGKKIVASRVGGLIELLGKNEERGWLMKLVPWESCDYAAPDELPLDRYEALAARVCEALRDQDPARCERAQHYACEQLDWHVVVAKTLAVYERLRTSL